jgi:ABC-type branched-subunit amino acid transport system ATPase component
MGKSSLLKTVLGFLPARSGSIRLMGQDVTTLAPHVRRRLALAYAPQEQALFQDLSVRENLRLGLLNDAGLEQRLAMVARWFPVLTSRLRQRAGTLSGGEQKMLIVARGLIAEPRLFLLDEVTEGLQPSVVDRVAEVLALTRRELGTAMLVVEQHIPFVLGLADRFAVFKRGEIVDAGSIDENSQARIQAHMHL